MEYHKDRFDDYSILVFEDNKLLAVVPANRVGNTVHSHQGLSYGVLVVLPDIRIKDYVAIFKEMMRFLNDNGVETIDFKLLPKIYNTTLADEIDYVSFLMKAEIFRSDVYLAIDMQSGYQPNRNRKRALKIAEESAVEIKEENEYTAFWNQILVPNLNDRFGINPVHTVAEMEQLSKLFPNEIKLFNAYQHNELKAGVVMFLTANAAHFQYSSGGNDRTETAALDALFDFLIQKYASKKYVSFGSSSEENGLKLNSGLSYWKESFGAKATVQNYVRFKTSDHPKLESFLL